MSTILKALRRLEQDRQAEAEPALDVAVIGAVPAADTRASRRWIAGVLAAAALGAGAVLLLQRGGIVSGPGTPPVAGGLAPLSETQIAPAALAPPVPVVHPIDTAPLPSAAQVVSPPVPGAGSPAPPLPDVALAPPPPDGESASSLPDVALPPPPSAVPDARPPATDVASAPAGFEPPVPPDAAPALRDTPPRVARLEPHAAAPKPALPGRAARGAETGAVVAQPVTRGTADESEGDAVRTIEPARRRMARAAPATAGISVLRTVWHPKPERRTALLEAPGDTTPHEYREGDRLGSFTLLRIEPSAVVLERDGVELREKLSARP